MSASPSNKQATPLKIGIAGLGTVGGGTVDLLQRHGKTIAERSGRGIEITAVNARNRHKDRGIDISNFPWFDDPVDMACFDGIDVFVELIGGSSGIALEAVEKALSSGKDVITANKAMLAEHGGRLASLAEENGSVVAYESAIAGGVPIVKCLRESLAGNDFGLVYGILNGTCNYVLTTMRESGRSFADVLDEAQALGYAEADPTFDVDGFDAAHKLTLLASLAFGGKPRFDAMHIEGIRAITAEDVAYADELGYRVKLLGLAKMTSHGLEQRLHPCLVQRQTPIAGIEGVLNAVVVDAKPVNSIVLEGPGAGAGPTASAVVSDLVDLARGIRLPMFGIRASELQNHAISPMGAHEGCYYMRMHVLDEPGVMADVATVLRDHQVSIASLIQRGRNPGQAVTIVLTTHSCQEQSMQDAIVGLADLKAVKDRPTIIRIEEFNH